MNTLLTSTPAPNLGRPVRKPLSTRGMSRTAPKGRMQASWTPGTRKPLSGRKPSSTSKSKSKSRSRRSLAERPPWNSTVSDVDKLKLDEKDKLRKKLLHTSRNDVLARQRLEEECGIPLDQQEEAFYQFLGPQALAAADSDVSSDELDQDVERFEKEKAAEEEEAKDEDDKLVDILKGLFTQVQAYEDAMGLQRTTSLPEVRSDSLASAAVEAVARCCVYLSDCELRVRTVASQHEAQAVELAEKNLEVEDLRRRLDLMKEYQERTLLHTATQTASTSPKAAPDLHVSKPKSVKVLEDHAGACDKAKISRRHQLLMQWKENSGKSVIQSGSIGRRVEPLIIE